MAQITRILFWHHLRGEDSSHIVHSRGGVARRAGRGLSFWFLPLAASISEVPLDDRELPILFHGRSSEFQDVTVQAVAAWRVVDPDALARRVDFAIDLSKGSWVKEPMEKMSTMLTELAQQLAWDYLARTSLQEILAHGIEPIRDLIRDGLVADEGIASMGIEIVSVRISSIRPTADVERALQTPARERIQQEADRATFERRALAVKQERAIEENELQNRIELAKQEETLIEQQGANANRRVRDEAQQKEIEARGKSDRLRMHKGAEAEGIRLVEMAKVEAEQASIDIYRELPQEVLLGLAARTFAENVPPIEHLNLSPDLLGPALSRLASAASGHLEG
jgi:regulator of protease activity HflC (stomatin/prohibitin superfamily)